MEVTPAPWRWRGLPRRLRARAAGTTGERWLRTQAARSSCAALHGDRVGTLLDADPVVGVGAEGSAHHTPVARLAPWPRDAVGVALAVEAGANAPAAETEAADGHVADTGGGPLGVAGRGGLPAGVELDEAGALVWRGPAAPLLAPTRAAVVGRRLSARAPFGRHPWAATSPARSVVRPTVESNARTGRREQTVENARVRVSKRSASIAGLQGSCEARTGSLARCVRTSRGVVRVIPSGRASRPGCRALGSSAADR
jgi:hypothetical protein